MMHIIALAWIYIASMIAITEKSVIAGILTFTLYCALPLGLIWYTQHSIKKRRNPKKTEPKEQGHDNSKSG